MRKARDRTEETPIPFDDLMRRVLQVPPQKKEPKVKEPRKIRPRKKKSPSRH